MTPVNILICNISASIMILLTLLLRRIAKNKIPNSVFCLLWLMVGIRLLFPIPIRTPFSFLNVYFHFRNEPVLLEAIPGGAGRPFPMAGQLEAVEAVAGNYKAFIFTIWLIGFCVAVVHFTMGYFMAWKDMGNSRPLNGAEWMDACVAEQKIRRKILFRVKDGMGSPATWGVIRPVIYFPADFDFENRELARSILLHECGHIKYFHFVFKLWNKMLVSLYWYNPVIWIMYLKFERDLEISADRYALRHAGNTTKDAYAYHLIMMAEKINVGGGFSVASGFCKNRETRERVDAIMNFKKMGVGAAIATLLIPLGMTSVFASTNDLLASQETTDLVVELNVSELEEIKFEIEETESISVVLEWDEIKSYISDDSTRAAASLRIENYEYVMYGRIPPKEIDVVTTVDGHKYSGTLTRGDYVYKSSTNQYIGYYSGRIYLQD